MINQYSGDFTPRHAARKPLISYAIAAFFLCAAGAAEASNLSLIDGFGYVNSNTVNTGNDTTKPSGFVSVDADNYAEYFVNTSAGTLGVRAGNSSNGEQSAADVTHTDSWVCVGQLCSLPVLEPTPVMFGFSLSGTASNSGAPLSVTAAYTEGSNHMSFSFLENQTDTANGIEGFFCIGVGDCTSLHPTFYLDKNDVYHFSVSASLPGTICNMTCSVVGLEGVGGPNHTAPMFTDQQFIQTSVTGDGTPEFADALDPFTVSITSLNPNVQLVSVDGRTTLGGTTATPEPKTVLLLATALGIVIFCRWRFRCDSGTSTGSAALSPTDAGPRKRYSAGLLAGGSARNGVLGILGSHFKPKTAQVSADGDRPTSRSSFSVSSSVSSRT
jgi:hypothetical protein